MSTKFEKYLKENRRVFDVEYPDDEAIWRRMEENRPEQNRSKKGRSIRISAKFQRIAASVIIVIALSYIAIDLSIGISFNNNNSSSRR